MVTIAQRLEVLRGDTGLTRPALWKFHGAGQFVFEIDLLRGWAGSRRGRAA